MCHLIKPYFLKAPSTVLFQTTPIEIYEKLAFIFTRNLLVFKASERNVLPNSYYYTDKLVI